MLVSKLVEVRKEKKTTDTWLSWLRKEIEITPYISWSIKCLLADEIIKHSCFKDGELFIDSPKVELLYMFTLLNEYTNIEVDISHFVKDYDDLNKDQILSDVIRLIPESEKSELSTILNMKRADLMTNQYENHAYWNKQIEKFSLIFSTVCKDVLTSIDENNKKIDPKKIVSFLDKKLK